MLEEWNINHLEGEQILVKLITNIIVNDDKIKNLPILLKKEATRCCIKIEKNGKKRNINNYIKKKYGSIDNLLIELNNFFIVKDDIIVLQQNEDYEFC